MEWVNFGTESYAISLFVVCVHWPADIYVAYPAETMSIHCHEIPLIGQRMNCLSHPVIRLVSHEPLWYPSRNLSAPLNIIKKLIITKKTSHLFSWPQATRNAANFIFYKIGREGEKIVASAARTWGSDNIVESCGKGGRDHIVCINQLFHPRTDRRTALLGEASNNRPKKNDDLGKPFLPPAVIDAHTTSNTCIEFYLPVIQND